MQVANETCNLHPATCKMQPASCNLHLATCILPPATLPMNRSFAFLLLLLINVIWGSSFAVAKLTLQELSPALLGAYRFLFAAALLWMLRLWFGWRSKGTLSRLTERVTTVDKWKLAGLGSIGAGFAHLIAYVAIDLTTATEASLLMIGEVIFTMLLAWWWTHEPIGRWKLSGMALGVIGVTIVILCNVSDAANQVSATQRVSGDLMLLVALFMQAVYSVLGTDLARKYHPFTMLTYANSGSLVVWVPLLLWNLYRGQVPASISWNAIIGIVYLALMVTLLAYLIWFGVARHIGAGASSISLFVQPLVGTSLGIYFLGESLTTSLWIGAFFIFTAMYLTTLSQPVRLPTPSAKQASGVVGQ